MANEEYLAILEDVFSDWNEWRKENPSVEIDLSGADLNGAILIGKLFIEADLNEANLNKADLRFADLNGANLNEADLREANLSKADLTGANLSGADFRGANLYKANLNETNLGGANLGKAIIGNTSIGKVDLSDVAGLEKVIHYSPSTIGTDTIQKSNGKIPDEFLRGCGLSDMDIEYSKLADPELSVEQIAMVTYKIHDLKRGGGSIQYFSIFISYSTKDGEFAQKLHDDLQNNDVRCWFAPHDIEAGKKIHEQIGSAIRAHDRLLLILSDDSMNSEWVKTEIAEAREKEIEEGWQVLFPISLVEYEKIRKWKCFDAEIGKDSAREIREYFIPDFSQWRDENSYREAFERLLRDLKASGEPNYVFGK